MFNTYHLDSNRTLNAIHVLLMLSPAVAGVLVSVPVLSFAHREYHRQKLR